MPDTVTIDMPFKVHPSDAVTFMVHHLAIAASYFEATPNLPHGSYAEIGRVFDQHPGLAPARAWYDAMVEAYEDK